jgi:hypothetical protein
VVQVTVADVEVMAVTVTALITGVPANVTNVEFGELADVPAEFAETTSKLYVVPADRPVSVTE